MGNLDAAPLDLGLVDLALGTPMLGSHPAAALLLAARFNIRP